MSSVLPNVYGVSEVGFAKYDGWHMPTVLQVWEADTLRPAGIIWCDYSSKKEKRCRSLNHKQNPDWQKGSTDSSIMDRKTNKALWKKLSRNMWVFVWDAHKPMCGYGAHSCLCTCVRRPQVNLECLVLRNGLPFFLRQGLTLGPGA